MILSDRADGHARPSGHHYLVLAILALSLLSPTMVSAQTPPDSSGAGSDSPSVVIRQFPSPGGAFLRSALVPGWGQAAYGAYLRGGIYFSAEAGSWFMLLKSIARLGEARDIERWRVASVRDSLLTAIEADPALAEAYQRVQGGLDAAIDAEIDEHPSVLSIRKLVDARKEQREDWLVLTLFWMLASGVDAFVTAHLSDFPAKVSAEALPSGRYDLGVKIPVGGPR